MTFELFLERSFHLSNHWSNTHSHPRRINSMTPSRPMDMQLSTQPPGVNNVSTVFLLYTKHIFVLKLTLSFWMILLFWLLICFNIIANVFLCFKLSVSYWSSIFNSRSIPDIEEIKCCFVNDNVVSLDHHTYFHFFNV